MIDVRAHLADPGPALEAAFRRIQHERMAGVGVLHPGLEVEAVGFRRHGDHWIGALVTPWFLDLVRVPGDVAGWSRVADGKRSFVRLPRGDFAFLGAWEPELGEFQSCSLVSPMSSFADQASARETAREALVLALTPPESARGTGVETDRAEVARHHRTAIAQPGRRGFLFGRAAG